MDSPRIGCLISKGRAQGPLRFGNSGSHVLGGKALWVSTLAQYRGTITTFLATRRDAGPLERPSPWSQRHHYFCSPWSPARPARRPTVYPVLVASPPTTSNG